MKAVVLREPQRFEFMEVPTPRLRTPYEVLIRVEACGICGSDLRYWAGENPWALHTLGRHVPNPPNIILGHEFAGVVAEVNSAEYEHLLGRRVGAQAFRVCGQCRFCCSGRENLCRNTLHFGHAQGWGQMEFYPGAYAEYCPAWGDVVYPIPDEVPLQDAAMADVVCVAVHVVGRNPNPRGDALCIGGGPIGVSIAQVAKARGAPRVVVSEPSPVARQVLASFGDLVTIDPSRESLAAGLRRHTESGTVAAIYDSIGSADVVAEALPLLEESGTYVQVAVHDAPITFNAMALGAERTLTSSSNALNRDVAQAYELIFSRQVNVAPMITHCFPLAEVEQAFKLLLQSPKQAFKAVLMPGEHGETGSAGMQ